MAEIKVTPSQLAGEVIVPPSKSISHRAILAAALAKGKSTIDNINLSEDIIATCQAVESMGVIIDIENSSLYADRKKLTIHGQGKLKLKSDVINCNESGSTLRFIIPVLATTGETVVLEGKGRLVERPLDVYYDIFKSQNLEYENDNGCLPLKLMGKLTPGEYKVRGDVSSQFITGLMFALPLLDWHSEIKLTTPLESIGYVDLTGDILNVFGIEYETLRGYNSIRISGNQKYESCDYVVEGDWSQAGFWIAVAANSGTIKLKGLNTKSKQGDMVILEIFKNMGGNVQFDGNDIIISRSELHGTEIDVKDCPDLVPYIAAMACFAKGTTTIYNASRLRIKESDRLKAIADEFTRLGANIEEYEDRLILHGVTGLKGGKVHGWNDHRIVMALAAVSSRCEEEIVISDSHAISKSYPALWEDFKNVGGVTVE